jgi:predicted amidohydrolase YtcJ
MTDLTRRTFLAGTGLAAAGAVLGGAPGLAAASTRSIATVITNGRVWTGCGPVERAVAIDGRGCIAAVGTNREIRSLATVSTEVVDANGSTVIAGIQDGHVHPTAVVQYLIYPTLDDAQLTLAEMQSALTGFLDDPATVFPGGWLMVLGWNPVACPSDALPANKSYLDAVSTTVPILLRGSDGHNSFVNSKALQLAGITAATPDPTGGQIVRLPNGEPSGVLVDSAQGLVTSLVPDPTTDEQLPYMQQISWFMASKGITSFLDAWVNEDKLKLYGALSASGGLLQRAQMALLVPSDLFGNPTQALAWADELATQYADISGVRIRTVKVFLDGVMEYPAQTASLLRPYLDGNGNPTDNYGSLYVENPTLARLVTAFDRAGWQVHFHAIGDRAVRTGLDAFAAALNANGATNGRHSIAHLQLVHPDDYARFAALGVVPVWQLQWACDDYWTGPALEPYIGARRHARLYPAHSVAVTRARMAGGSDWPVDPLYPWNQVATAVDRIGIGGLPESGAGGTGQPLDPHQAISLEQSLRMHTAGSAYELHQERSTGTIAVGKQADLQILDVDVSAVSTAELAWANVVRTFVGGQTTYDASATTVSAARAAGARGKAATQSSVAERIEAAAALASKSGKACGCGHQRH